MLAGSLRFILSQTLKMHNKGLDKPIDFIIPGAAVDEANIRALIQDELSKIGVSQEDIVFISKEETKLNYQSNEDSTSPKIRIISPFITKSEDYKALYAIATEGTGCSGDNSISDSFSSPSLPFFQYKESIIGSFYYDELLTTLQQERDACQDDDVREGLTQLHTYFEVMIKLLDNNSRAKWPHSDEFEKLNIPKLFDAILWSEPELIHQQFDLNAFDS